MSPGVENESGETPNDVLPGRPMVTMDAQACRKTGKSELLPLTQGLRDPDSSA